MLGCYSIRYDIFNSLLPVTVCHSWFVCQIQLVRLNVMNSKNLSHDRWDKENSFDLESLQFNHRFSYCILWKVVQTENNKHWKYTDCVIYVCFCQILFIIIMFIKLRLSTSYYTSCDVTQIRLMCDYEHLFHGFHRFYQNYWNFRLVCIWKSIIFPRFSLVHLFGYFIMLLGLLLQ